MHQNAGTAMHLINLTSPDHDFAKPLDPPQHSQNAAPTPVSAPGVLIFPPPSSGPRIATSNPAAMVPDAQYNLLEDLRQAQAQHASGAKEKVSLYQFPSYLSTNIRRVLARNRSHRADWSLAMSCLLWQGLTRYVSHPAARGLSSALSELDLDDDLQTLAGEQVEIWRRGFRFSIGDPTHTMGMERVRSFKAADHVHTELYDMAGKVGISGSTLGIVCVMAALEGQEGVLREHGQYMRDCVAELDTLLVERERRLKGLTRAIEAGVWR